MRTLAYLLASVAICCLGSARALAAEVEKDQAKETSEPKKESIWTGTAVDADGKKIAEVRVDTTDAPDLADWGKQAGELCVEWYPKIIKLLDSDGFKPYGHVEVYIGKHDGIAATGRNRIGINADYVRGHKDDLGMVAHELTHVVQAYHSRGNPGWLVEGIADYVRLSHYEPKARRPRINPDRAKYTDAYKTTAIFLEWSENKYDKELVKKLNAAMRKGDYKEELFKTYTGKTVDELWKEFTDTLRANRKPVKNS